MRTPFIIYKDTRPIRQNLTDADCFRIWVEKNLQSETFHFHLWDDLEDYFGPGHCRPRFFSTLNPLDGVEKGFLFQIVKSKYIYLQQGAWIQDLLLQGQVNWINWLFCVFVTKTKLGWRLFETALYAKWTYRERYRVVMMDKFAEFCLYREERLSIIAILDRTISNNFKYNFLDHMGKDKIYIGKYVNWPTYHPYKLLADYHRSWHHFKYPGIIMGIPKYPQLFGPINIFNIRGINLREILEAYVLMSDFTVPAKCKDISFDFRNYIINQEPLRPMFNNTNFLSHYAGGSYYKETTAHELKIFAGVWDLFRWKKFHKFPNIMFGTPKWMRKIFNFSIYAKKKTFFQTMTDDQYLLIHKEYSSTLNDLKYCVWNVQAYHNFLKNKGFWALVRRDRFDWRKKLFDYFCARDINTDTFIDNNFYKGPIKARIMHSPFKPRSFYLDFNSNRRRFLSLKKNEENNIYKELFRLKVKKQWEKIHKGTGNENLEFIDQASTSDWTLLSSNFSIYNPIKFVDFFKIVLFHTSWVSITLYFLLFFFLCIFVYWFVSNSEIIILKYLFRTRYIAAYIFYRNWYKKIDSYYKAQFVKKKKGGWTKKEIFIPKSFHKTPNFTKIIFDNPDFRYFVEDKFREEFSPPDYETRKEDVLFYFHLMYPENFIVYQHLWISKAFVRLDMSNPEVRKRLINVCARWEFMNPWDFVQYGLWMQKCWKLEKDLFIKEYILYYMLTEIGEGLTRILKIRKQLGFNRQNIIDQLQRNEIDNNMLQELINSEFLTSVLVKHRQKKRSFNDAWQIRYENELNLEFEQYTDQDDIDRWKIAKIKNIEDKIEDLEFMLEHEELDESFNKKRALAVYKQDNLTILEHAKAENFKNRLNYVHKNYLYAGIEDFYDSFIKIDRKYRINTGNVELYDTKDFGIRNKEVNSRKVEESILKENERMRELYSIKWEKDNDKLLQYLAGRNLKHLKRYDEETAMKVYHFWARKKLGIISVIPITWETIEKERDILDRALVEEQTRIEKITDKEDKKIETLKLDYKLKVINNIRKIDDIRIEKRKAKERRIESLTSQELALKQITELNELRVNYRERSLAKYKASQAKYDVSQARARAQSTIKKKK